jgi:hypothetical protein
MRKCILCKSDTPFFVDSFPLCPACQEGTAPKPGTAREILIHIIRALRRQRLAS